MTNHKIRAGSARASNRLIQPIKMTRGRRISMNSRTLPSLARAAAATMVMVAALSMMPGTAQPAQASADSSSASQGTPTVTISNIRPSQSGNYVYVKFDVNNTNFLNKKFYARVWWNYTEGPGHCVHNPNPSSTFTNSGTGDCVSTGAWSAVSKIASGVYRDFTLQIPASEFPSGRSFVKPHIVIWVDNVERANVASSKGTYINGTGRNLAGYRVTFSINRLICYDGEEDDYVTSSGEDEVYLLYGLYEVDAYGNVVRGQTGSWGVYDMERGVGFDARTGKFQTLTLDVPLNSDVGVSIVLMESEDYDTAVSAVNIVHGLSASALKVGTLYAPEAVPALTIVEVIAASAYGSVKLVDMVDEDDQLGEVTDVVPSNELSGWAQTTQSRVSGWNISGTNNTDAYFYDLGYAISVVSRYR